jgi:cell division protein ZapA
MSVITITVNNKKFQIACNDGQEELVQNAAITLSEKIEMLKRISPSPSTRIITLSCVL